jgi:hypothetical protein
MVEMWTLTPHPQIVGGITSSYLEEVELEKMRRRIY